MDTATDTSLGETSAVDPGFPSEGGTAYTGVGAPLDVSFTGTFVNASPWVASSSTLSNLLTPGVSYSVDNASSVTWTANVLVSPPVGVSTLSFSVSFPVTDWKPVSVADPFGVYRTNPTEWYPDYDTIVVRTAAVDTYGVWTLTFTAVNHLIDLEMGPSGGPYTSTTTFDTGATARFGVSSSWITGASAEFDLIDPSGTVRYTLTNTTSGSITHALPSFRYHKDITIHNEYVTGDFTNFPVLVDIIDSDLKTDVQTDGDDIVFYSNGMILSHEIELFDQAYSGSDAHLVAWVKANLSNLVDTIITMYYGNSEVGPQSQPEDVWTSNYAAVWHLNEDATDEGTSTDHLDSTGNGYYGDQSGNNDITGIFGVGQNFDGTNDVINIAAARGLEPSGSVTLSGWFKLDNNHNQNTGVTQVLLTKAIDGDTDMHVLLAGSDYIRPDVQRGSLVFKMENGGLGQMYVWSLRRSWTADTWYYFTCTMTASTPSLNKVFVNGQENTNSTSGGLSTASLAFTDDWEIGGGFVDQMSPTYGYFDGVIDEVRVSTGIRPNSWIQTEWLMYQSSSNFRTLASDTAQTSPNMYVEQIIGASDPSGSWTVSAHYNDSGSSVSHRVGEYQRNFIVRRASTLDITSPTDAAAGLETMTVGELLYLVVDLSDTSNTDQVIGATVSMNWTVSGVSTTAYFEDLGDGRYSVARNTSELNDRGRWRINVDSTHPYYFDSSTYFDLDIYHPTQLSYEWVTTTPVGFDVNATLVYRDTWDGSLISGASITLIDGTPVTAIPWGLGRYNVTIDSNALAPGAYSELFNATKSSDYYRMASSNVTYIMRPHYTAVSVSGNLETPYGVDTTINIVLVDLDTGQTLDATVVDSLSFDSFYGTQFEPSVSNLNGIILDTNSWAVNATYSIDLSVVMSDSDYYAPDPYTFVIEIRNHLTAVNLVGDLTTAYGANTTVTVSLTDLDGGTILIGSVSSFTFTSTQPIQIYNSPSGFTFDLETDTWPVSTIQVTLSVVLSGNYDNPTNYVFYVTIRSLQTTLYNAPTNLLFTQTSDFTIDVHFNVSEVGQYYGLPINGESGQFLVTSSLTLSGTTITPLGNGMYRIMIPWSNFDGQGTDFTINVGVTPSSNLYSSASIVIQFKYRPIISDLTANLYTVSTPYNMDVTIHLYFADRDSGTGITTATISASPDIFISGPHIADGDYLVTLDSSTLSIGSHAINLTATASGYDSKWVIITIVVTQIHTNANPSTIYLEIPSGNTKVFTITWTDLDNSLPIQTAIINIANNWTGTAPVIIWTGTQYQITFETTASDSLGIYLLWFNFTKGAEYQPGYCEIQIEIRSHDTILTAESPPPTAYNSIINISVYFYDFDNKVGIKDALVDFYVWNASGLVSSTYEDDLILGNGHYIIHISASQFGLGPQTFTIFVEWLGAIQQYENNNVIVSATIAGVDSLLTLTLASDPSAYSEIMVYEFVYSEKDSGIGITNSSYGGGHVSISISFDVTFDMLKVTITEVNAGTNPGLYRIEIDTTGFDTIGQFSMTITIDWTGAEPFYSTRENTVSVWVLSRNTLLLINPPSPESYGEIATFSFSWQDTGTTTNILNSSALNISMDIIFNLAYNAGVFTITFNTNQFAAVGNYLMTLNVTWAGEPFYSNRTNRLISINVLPRQTTLDYPTPDPTFYGDNVTITVTWTDVTNGGNDGILGATITVSDINGVISPAEYDLRALPNGVYEIEFDTSRFSTTALWSITVKVHVDETYIADKELTRTLDLRERRTILSIEAIGKVAYGDTIGFILYFDDLYTATIIGNSTGDVTLEILTPGTWLFTSMWNAVDERYDVMITSYPSYPIGSPFAVTFRMSYSNVAPFYGSDDLVATFELRERLSLLSLEVAPNPTPYLDDAVFLVQFLDVDADTGINADYIWVYFGMTKLNIGSEYTYTPLGGGYYELTVNSTFLGGIGVNPVTVHAYWISGAPYHNNASAAVNIRVTTRATIVDVTVPPSQTPFLNDVTFTFEYSDLVSGSAITSILTTDISLYNNGSLVAPGDYSLTPSGSAFILTVDSEILGPTLGRYNLTIVVDWNELSSPYYVDAKTSTWVTVTTRTLSFTLDPVEETPFGHFMNITFTLNDFATGTPVDGAIITFSAQAISLTLGVDYFITPLTGGNYLIEINTTPFITPGNFLFNLNIGWNPSTSPYYKSMKTIVLTGVISDFETTLLVQSDQITVNWGSPANLEVYYRDLIGFNAITGALVEWESSVFGTGVFDSEFPALSGNYSVSINTGTHDAGTYIISIRASKNNYELARAYITIVVQPLESDIVLIDPNVPVFPINRGAALLITIRLEDAGTNPIPNTYVNLVQVTVEGGGTYTLFYSGTPGVYTRTLPSDDTDATKRVPGSYNIIITASMRNYEPAASSFKILVLQSATAVHLTGDTKVDMSRTYTQNVTVYVQVVLPDSGDAPFWNVTVSWSVVDTLISGAFTHLGNGNFSAVIRTTEVGFGIWNIIFKATPFANSSLYATSQTTISFAITRIQTSSIPPETRDFYWGWAGNLIFIYWDETFDRGISGADVTIELPGLENIVFDVGNGSYLVFFNTSLLRASNNYIPLPISFSKLNYAPSSATINIRVLEVPTDIFVNEVDYTPDYSGQLDDFEDLNIVNLQIPYGDSMIITFYYNDTENSEGYVGGLSGAIATLNSYLRGPTFDGYLNMTVIDLGNGLYQVTFDTLLPEIFGRVDSESYRLYIELSLDNRTTTDILFRVRIIDITTTLTIVNDQPAWYLVNGESITIELLYWDTWHNTGISGAYFSANASSGAPFTVSTEVGSTPGQYFVIITSSGIKLTPSSGTVIILLGDGVYTIGEHTIGINVILNSFDDTMSLLIVWGVPLGLIFLMVGFAYIRVWNVPKRLRQINGQIKTIRKGKVPKPITEAASRQALIAGLFNDTYAKLGITRTPKQMPEESIPVDVPELGELLIQLAILTNLNQQELDDFKADIAKMKISEQAAFVKEVIIQEAIRAARRDHKTVEEILEEVQEQARGRLAGEGEDADVKDSIVTEEEEPDVETVILPEKDVTPAVDKTKTYDDGRKLDSRGIDSHSEKLSPFEIEELKKDLEHRGVPAHEIDVILKQAKELPRDLVEELIRSLGRDRGV